MPEFGREVFDRPLTRGAIGLLLLSVTLVALCWIFFKPLNDGVSELVRGVRLPILKGTVTLAAELGFLLGPAVTLIVVFAWLGRFCRCELTHDAIVYRPKLLPFQWVQRVVFSGSDVDERRVTPRGVLLLSKRMYESIPGWFPVLIPTQNDAEVARAVRLLDDAEARAHRDPPIRSGRVANFWLVAGLVIPIMVTGGCISLVANQAYDWRLAVAFLIAWLGWFAFGALALNLAHTPLVAGLRLLVMGNLITPYDRVESLAVSEAHISVEAQGRRFVTRLDEGVSVPLRERLRSLGVHVSEHLPPWAKRRTQRRSLSRVGIACVLLMVAEAAIVFLPARSLQMTDHHGQTLRLEYRRWSWTLLAISVAEAGAVAPLERGALVHATASGVRRETSPLSGVRLHPMIYGALVNPGTTAHMSLRTLAPGTGPLLTELRSGQNSTRCFMSTGSGGEVIFGKVDRGRVQQLTVLPTLPQALPQGRGPTAVAGDVRCWCQGGQGWAEWIDAESTPFARVDPNTYELRVATAPFPSALEIYKAETQFNVGTQTVEAFLAPYAPELWPPAAPTPASSAPR